MMLPQMASRQSWRWCDVTDQVFVNHRLDDNTDATALAKEPNVIIGGAKVYTIASHFTRCKAREEWCTAHLR